MLLLLLGCFTAVPASAHFKLLQPASWLMEDSSGGPQKGSPCGPGKTGFLGDDVQPVPTTGTVTTFHAGETIKVDLQETVYHPGYFRIALAANRSDLKDPPLTDASACTFDLNTVPTGAHDNVLLDGLYKVESPGSGGNRHLMQDVKLPDTPCDKCTLQVIQVMKDHGLSSCFYYHCADIKIIPASSTAGSGASGSAAGAAATPTAGSAGTTAPLAAGTGANAAAGSTSTPLAGRTGSAGTSAGTPGAAAGTVAAGVPAAGAGSMTPAPPAAGTSGASPTAAQSHRSGCALVGLEESSLSSSAFAGWGLLVACFVMRLRRGRSKMMAS
jgi:hypothetical protein